MAIYKYTLIKYMKAKSTWIIALISGVVIGFLLGGLVPFTTIDVNSSSAATDYTITIISTIAGVTSFLSIFASVFAGFKASSMYKDEVEDGTFLVILSKPMRRSSIIFFKWLSLQTVIFGWAIFTVICFISGIAAFDKGYKIEGLKELGVSTVTSQLPIVGAYVLIILFVTGLIFSSIGLLLSTKLSVGSTIGISIALGIIIPITSLIGVFLKKDSFKVLTNRELALQERSFQALDGLNNPLAPVAKQIHDFQNSASLENIYKLGVSTGSTNMYNWAWIIDLNYQISQLSTFASGQVIPEAAKEYAQNVSDASSNAPGNGGKKIQSTTVIKAMADHLDSSEIVKDLKDALDQYFTLGGQMADSSTQALQTALSTNYGLTVNVPSIDRTLLTSIWQKANVAAPTGAPAWMQNAVNGGTIISVKDIVDLMQFVYADADYKELVKFSEYEQDPSAANSVNWLKYQVNKMVKNLVTDLSSAKLVAPSDPLLSRFNLKDLVKTYGATLEKLNNPVTAFFIKEDNLRSATNDILGKEFKMPDGSSTTYETAARDALGSSTLLGGYASLLSTKDLDAVVQIISASMAGKLNEVKTVDYVNKNALLAGYIVVALALVPIAYWVVKKQDFR